MYSATANRARARAAEVCRWYMSFFNVAKNDSAAALSQHTPVRPRLRRIPFLVVKASNSADVYWAALYEDGGRCLQGFSGPAVADLVPAGSERVQVERPQP